MLRSSIFLVYLSDLERHSLAKNLNVVSFDKNFSKNLDKNITVMTRYDKSAIHIGYRRYPCILFTFSLNNGCEAVPYIKPLSISNFNLIIFIICFDIYDFFFNLKKNILLFINIPK